MPTMASPRPREALAISSGSSKKVVAFTTAAARWAGLPDLKMPEPTNTPSAPSCIIIAASAGGAMPPAGNRTTGSLPRRATSATRAYGARSSFAAAKSSGSSRGASALVPARVERMWGGGAAAGGPGLDAGGGWADVGGGPDDVGRAGLALGADHRRALGDAAQCLAQVGGAADERNGERALRDVVRLVGRGEHLRLVDVVDA